MEWWKNSVIYEIMPKSFYDSNNDGWGDLEGVIEKLDYLKYLGINAIWFTPFWESGGMDNGYDIADYKKVEKTYGNNKILTKLIKECKKRDIKIIFDIVMSHTSFRNKWFIKSRKNKNNRYRNWYIWRKNTTNSNLYSIYEGSPWTFDTSTMESYFHLFSKDMPDLNYENPKVRKYFKNLIKYYLKMGVEGFRFDVIDVIGKDIDNGIISEGEKLVPFIYEIAKKGWKNNQEIMTVGEGWNINAKKSEKYAGFHNKGLSMVFWLRQILTQDIGNDLSIFQKRKFSPNKLRKIVYEWQKSTEGSSWNALFFNNHDTGRAVSRWGSKKYLSQSAKTIATTFYTMKGTPFIYQGEEIGMTNSTELKNITDFPCIQAQGKYRELVLDKKIISHDEFHKGYLSIEARDNSKTPIQWNHKKNAGFSKVKPWLSVNNNYKKINIEDQINDENSILNHYRKLIKIRNNNKFTQKILTNGKFITNNSKNNIFDFKIKYKNSYLRTIANWSENSEIIVQDKGKLIINSNLKNKSKKIGPWESRVYLYMN